MPTIVGAVAQAEKSGHSCCEGGQGRHAMTVGQRCGIYTANETQRLDALI